MTVRFDNLLAITLVLVAIMMSASCSCGDDDDDADETADDDASDSDTHDDDVDDDSFDDDDTDDDDTDDDDAGDDDTGDDDDVGMPWLVAETGAAPAIFDEFGRQVILRGANFNHLGDYFETDPRLPTVAELSGEDWDDAAALGMNVVRLVTSWSAWEPERDAFDTDYLDRVRDAIGQANARGIYVVIDMHQDAWSKFVFTPAGDGCPNGTHHQIGWDGAPEWATYTDGEPTCTPGRREQSPAVIRAWENFWTNHDGIRDELVELWGRVAAEFAHEPGVAGFDLLNEPGHGDDFGETFDGLTTFYRDAIGAIRDAEHDAGAPGHIVFFETSVFGVPPAFDLVDSDPDANLVFAPHNYFASIIPGPLGLLDVGFFLFDGLGRIYGTTVWTGEYNSFSDPATNEAWTTRFAALDDGRLFAGGTWWQWEQECGDPHNIPYPPSEDWITQQQAQCGDARFDVSSRPCLSRAYPRAAPGRLTRIDAKPCGEGLVAEGTSDAAGLAEVWFPSASGEAPAVSGHNIGEFDVTAVDGGYMIFVEVGGEYVVTIAE
ncbi:glycoside hydrolase family 5 protein [bacterium]|nr:glycoside hydrolase family 5 protein [bacterium]